MKSPQRAGQNSGETCLEKRAQAGGVGGRAVLPAHAPEPHGKNRSLFKPPNLFRHLVSHTFAS